MTQEQLRQLHKLLDAFQQIPDHHGSIYGRDMDIACAKSVQQALVAYGLEWKAKLLLEDGTDYPVGHYSKEGLLSLCERLIELKNDPASSGIPSQPIAYELI